MPRTPLLVLPLLLAAQDGRHDPAATALASGELAFSENRLDDAYRHFLAALERRPDPAIMERILATLEDDEARVLWTHVWYAALADEQGRAPHPSVSRLLRGAPLAEEVAEARAKAVAELSRLAAAREKDGSAKVHERLVADWARRCALDLARRSPQLEAAFRDGLRADPPLPRGIHGPVLQALFDVTGDTGLGMRAARCLTGIVRQSEFQDLRGDSPRNMKGWARRSAARLDAARTRQRREADEPWTVEDLEWLTGEEGEAFTRAHDSFADPGVAISPRGWYRVESDCGFESLLGVARTVELHHERLANWYGTDPFVGEPGTVRVVPEHTGLEAEGAPYYWVGGFQGGPITVVRLAQSHIEALGHTITHELTHRFDGRLYPGQPLWLTEGKAVWTSFAYGPSTDDGFVEDHAAFGTIQGVYVKGWGRLDKLVELLEGPDDHRDNYSPGYSLYVYLNTWEVGGRRLFQGRLQHFMENGSRNRKPPRAFFEGCFCDGRDGRPEDLEAFAEGWQEFLAGFYWKTIADWTARYSKEVPPTPGQPFVFDEPTWTWARRRHEPYFGQDQARVAAGVLLDAGKSKEAARALVWAWLVDGREPRILGPLAGVLGELRQRDAAWVAGHASRFPLWSADGPTPIEPLRETNELLATLVEAAEAERDADRPRSAAALAADHDRLARWLGRPELGWAAPDLDGLRHPFDPPPRPLARHGWVESELAGFDDDGLTGLWYADEAGGLHVGRRAPRKGTGKVDRSGGGLAFVRADEHLLPGTYRVVARVHLTTSYVQARVVFGYRRRDQSLCLSFSAGDAMYAIGETEEEPTFEYLDWDLSGMWERDGPLKGSTPGGKVNFGRERTAFEVELLVDGASVVASVDGKTLGTYHTADGRPIEGYVGFATSWGTIRVLDASVQRLDRSRLAGRRVREPAGLDLAGGRWTEFDDLVNRPVHFGVPPASNGTLLLWIPVPWRAPQNAVDTSGVVTSAREAAKRLKRALDRDGSTQRVVVAVPAVLGEEALAELEAGLAALFPRPPTVIHHPFDGTAPPGWRDSPDLNKRWLIFVDAVGVARVAKPLGGSGFGADLQHWLTVFRDHGRPVRDLPEVRRASREGDGGPPPEDPEDD